MRGQRGDRKEQAEIDVGEYIPAEINTPVMEGLVLEMGSTQRNRQGEARSGGDGDAGTR